MIETFRVGSKGGATTTSCTSACEYRSVSANTGEIDQKKANLKPELAQKKKKSASSVATASSSEYAHAHVLERMGEGESHHRGLSLHQLALQHSLHQQQRRQRAPSQSRAERLSSAGGKIVEVQGGHIMRSIGRKDRHSKVCTAKGPRDRRVRLAAHTAIQFYDVQDRLGYDRPSKAVDWLIKNAKVAIDQLAELPAWNLTVVAPSAGHSAAAEQPSGQSNGKQISVDEPAVTAAFNFNGSDDGGDGGGAIGILPPLDNNSIADTIKSFFPMFAAAAAPAPASSSPPPIGFRSYPTDILPQTSNHSEDLRLSLQSFKDSIFQHSQSTHHPHNPTPSAYNLFDAASVGWAEQNRQMSSWFGPDPSGGGGGFGEFAFGAPPLHSALSLSHLFSQRGPLQSSNSPSARDWPEPGELQMHPVLLPSISSIGFTSDAGLSGFSIAGRVQGQEEHGGIANKLPSTSRH